jgi:hypothetical protein
LLPALVTSGFSLVVVALSARYVPEVSFMSTLYRRYLDKHMS